MLTEDEDGNIETKRGPKPGIPQRGTHNDKTGIAHGSGEAISHKKPAKPVGGMDPVVAMGAVTGGNRMGAVTGGNRIIVGGNKGYQPHTATLKVASTFD